MRKLVSVAYALLLVPTLASAQEADEWRTWPFAERFRIYVHAYFPNLDTEVRLDSQSGLIGTTISFEQNLGLSDTESIPAAGFGWRFAKRHRLRFDFFELNRSGSSVTTSEIRFGDTVFQADLPISSFMDTSVYSLSYAYSVLFNERAEIGLLAGLSVQDIAVGIKGTLVPGLLEEETGVTAPLPTFGVTGMYALNEQWALKANVAYFALELSFDDDENLGGELINVEAAVEYAPFDNVSFELRYGYFDLSTSFEGLGRLSEINYRYHGPKIGIVGRF